MDTKKVVIKKKRDYTKYFDQLPDLLVDYWMTEWVMFCGGEQKMPEMPSLVGFAQRSGYARSTLYNWINDGAHPALNDAWEDCRQMSEAIIAGGGLKGTLNGQMAMGILNARYGWANKSETLVGGVDNAKPISVDINIIGDTAPVASGTAGQAI